MSGSLQSHELYPARLLYVHEISQARILEWVAISIPRESSQTRDRTCISCFGRWILYCWVTAVLLTNCFSLPNHLAVFRKKLGNVRFEALIKSSKINRSMPCNCHIYQSVYIHMSVCEYIYIYIYSLIPWLRCAQLFATPWNTVHQASPSFTNSLDRDPLESGSIFLYSGEQTLAKKKGRGRKAHH